MKKLLYKLVIAPALLLTGCVYSDEEPCEEGTLPPVAEEMTPVPVNLTFVTRQGAGSQSRAAGDPQWPATEAECRIDLAGGDYRVLVFDNVGRLLQTLQTEVVREFEYKDGSATCLVRGTLANTWNDFQIVVLANCESLGLSYNSVLRNVSLLSTLMTNLRNITYTIPTSGWRPFDSGATPATKGIPMFGMQRYTDIDWSAAPTGQPLSLPTPVSMLRAVAKIEVVDCINPDALLADRASIDAVQLRGYNRVGCVAPDVNANPGWNQNDIQVIASTLPSAYTDIYAAAALIPFFKDDDVTIDGRAYTRYSAYVCEYSINQLADRVYRPQLIVTVNNPETEEVADKEIERTLDMAQYNDGTAGEPLQHLLRNHIYRFEVRSVGTHIVELYYTVCPWDEADIVIPVYPEN